MACRSTCRAWQPCYSAGCPNAPPPSTNVPGSPGPSSQRRGVNNSTDGLEEPYSWSNDNIRNIGVGHNSAEDINMDIQVDEVLRGRDSVLLGVGNTAHKDLTLRVSGFRVANVSHGEEDAFNASGSNYMNVNRGGQGSVRIGVGNQSGGDARIVISGNRIRPTSSANQEDGIRRGSTHRGRERWSFPFGDRRRH
ncbi:hypothetical protein IHE45_05G003000 [Dioscorea alata]|uniref:Uncharacterized protein n=1 Tax=Dioscorea alata TaxID=55571 RepID=A0ACB7VZK6_DIOAL|nr:hypothetical protein IHE45_05G003000 [Dioscorea alata]